MRAPQTPPALTDTRPVCVLGLGLIGGSVLRAATRAGRAAWGYNRSAGSADAAAADGFDAGTDLAAALRRAAARDALLVVAVPLPAVAPVLAAVAEHAPGCALTDVVSVKVAVAEAVRRAGLDARYVGGHPMAGTAHSGWAAGDADLFAGARWVVSVDGGRDPRVWAAVAALALDCGSVVVPAESAEHDAAVARVSHLPHLLAEALAASGAAGGELALALAAGSFRDGTRVAGSDPALVRAMCEGNAAALLPVLDEALAALTAARGALAAGSTEALVAAGHAARLRFENRTTATLDTVVPGADGWLEQLRAAGRAGLTLRRG